MSSDMELKFRLESEEGWPPVGVEGVPFEETSGGFRALVPPIFVKDISVGDLIEVLKYSSDGYVLSWRHLLKSGHTTIWLLRLSEPSRIEEILEELRVLGCNTVGLKEFGCYAVDVPPDLEISLIDKILENADPQKVGVAFPSFRHPE